MNHAKNIKRNYFLWLGILLVITVLVIITKKVFMLKDLINETNIILVISPLLFISAMLLAYGIYNRLLRDTKKNINATETEQWQAFSRANKAKFILLSIGGIIIALTLLLIWKTDYLYLLGIAFILFLIAYPNKTKFDIEFSKYGQVNDTKETQSQDNDQGEGIND